MAAKKKRRRPPGKKRGLTAKQKRFIAEYMVDSNATQAAIRAGYAAKAAAQQGSELLRNPLVAAELKTRQAQAAAKLELTSDMVKAEIRALAFANIGDILRFGPKGVVFIKADSRDLPRELLAAIAEVSQRDTEFGKVIRVKLHSKEAALRLLAQHLGMLIERHEHAVAEGGMHFYLPDNGRRPGG